MTTRFTAIFSACIRWILLVPFLVLSLIPAAVMPKVTANGVVMVICSGTEIIEVLIDPATGELLDESERDATSAPCDWASAKAMSVLPAQDLNATRPLLFKTAVEPIPSTTLARAEATGLPPSTGPPVES